MSTTAPDFSRQVPLALTIPQSVAIIGVGGVGSWLAMFLALAGVPALELWDSDIITATNLNRFPTGLPSLGALKVVAVGDLIRTLNADCSLMEYAREWTPDRADEPHDPPEWVVACTDTWASRRAAFEWAQANRVKYLEAASEGEYGSVTGEPATFVTADETNPGYASVPVHVGPCVMAASLAAYHLLHPSSLGQGSWRLGWTDGHFDVQQFSPTTIPPSVPNVRVEGHNPSVGCE